MKKVLSILIAICLIAGLLPVVASAAGETASVSIVSDASGSMTTLQIEEGGEAAYMVTDDDGFAHTETANASNYNIKFEWADGDLPTLYLKGANLKNGAAKRCILINKAGPEEYVIYTEEESTIEAENGDGIFTSERSVTVTGEGKLKFDITDGCAIQVYDERKPKTLSLTLLDADIELELEKVNKSSYGFSNHVRYLTVDGGNIKANAIGGPIFRAWGEMLITGGAQLDLYGEGAHAIYLSASTGSEYLNPEGFTMESGHLKIRKADQACIQVTNTVDGYVKIKGGTLDLDGGAFIYGPTVDFSEYEGDFTCVVSNTKGGKGAEPFDPEKADAMSKYCYVQLTLGSSYEVTVKNGTTETPVAASGDTVTITARIAPEGKAFDKWVVDTGAVTLADPTATTTTFTMPSENVKITATYKDVEEEDTGDDTTTDTGNDTNTNTGNDTNNNAGNDTNNNAGNDTNTNTGNDTNTNAGNDTNTNTGNNNVNLDDDGAESDGQRAKKKSGKTGIIITFVVIMVVMVLGTGGFIAYIVIKRSPKAEKAEEEVAEESDATEDAE